MGFQQGFNEGARHAVKLALGGRFGAFSAAVQDHLNSLSATDIDALMPQIVNAASIAEIFPA